jgi:hypothetical protein
MNNIFSISILQSGENISCDIFVLLLEYVMEGKNKLQYRRTTKKDMY